MLGLAAEEGACGRRLDPCHLLGGAFGHQLPAGLAALVQPGPLDETGWTLLVGSGAAAAKLRQCLPRLQQALSSQGWAELAIRVKVLVATR